MLRIYSDRISIVIFRGSEDVLVNHGPSLGQLQDEYVAAARVADDVVDIGLQFRSGDVYSRSEERRVGKSVHMRVRQSMHDQRNLLQYHRQSNRLWRHRVLPTQTGPSG